MTKTFALKSAICAVLAMLVACNDFENPNTAATAETQDAGNIDASADAQADNGQGTDASVAQDIAQVEVQQQEVTATMDTGPKPECVTATDCDDNNVCTFSYCDAGKCQHKAIEAKCDDNNACTDNDVCTAGACKGTVINCDDNNVCTDDFCQAGKCLHGVNEIGCDDGNACTEKDTCGGAKCNGTSVICDDNNPCTTDTCDPIKGCNFTAAVCEDNDPCTTDSCDIKTGNCSFVQKVCDDGKAWTDDWCADSWSWGNTPGSCVNYAKYMACQKDSDCTDDDPCTVDVCDSFQGQCVNITQQCDDDNPCTFADTCVGGGCYGIKKNCNDYNANTADSCDKATGACINTPISVVTPPTPTSATVKIEVSCGAVACEVHPFFGLDSTGKSFDAIGPAQANSWYSNDLPKSQLCVWGMEVAARLSSMPNLPWYGCDAGAPSLNTVTVKVNGVVVPGVLTKHPYTCSGGGEGNLAFAKAAFGCP